MSRERVATSERQLLLETCGKWKMRNCQLLLRESTDSLIDACTLHKGNRYQKKVTIHNCSVYFAGQCSILPVFEETLHGKSHMYQPQRHTFTLYWAKCLSNCTGPVVSSIVSQLVCLETFRLNKRVTMYGLPLRL